MYRAGWEVSKASLVANIVLAILLLFIGAIVFHESVDVKKDSWNYIMCIGNCIDKIMSLHKFQFTG